ncbi:hypothetical protein [Quisquiliibacterium transsilvanicum]
MAVAASVLAAGCATPARVDQMISEPGIAKRIAAPAVLKENVALRDVTGGRETNPMWVSSVGSSEFEGALAGSLRAAGMYSENRQAGRYFLTVHLEKLDQPLVGFNLTVTATVNYTLTERASGKDVFARTIATPYTAKAGDAFLAVERLKLANEGAIRTNIARLIDELMALRIDGVALR